MSGFGSAAWFWWGGALAMALAGLLLLFWALGWDWLRTRKTRPRRCPKCWYDLSGMSASMKCSECGYEAKRERKLHKSRRRWRWVFVGLLLILASGYPVVQPKVQRDGWWSLVSNRMLIAGLPFARDVDDFWCREMARRVQAGTPTRDRVLGQSRAAFLMPMTEDEWRAFFERCVEGDARARPISKDWRLKYGELLTIWSDGGWPHSPATSKAALAVQDILLQLPVQPKIRTRERWPAGVPLYLEGTIDSWWPYNTPLRATIESEIEGLQPTTLASRPVGILLPEREIGFQSFTLDAQLQYNHAPDARTTNNGEIKDIAPIPVKLEIVPEMVDCITPFRSKEVTDALSAGLVATIDEMGGSGRLFLVLDVLATINPQLDGIAIGAEAEVLSNGEVVHSNPVWWEPGSKQRLRSFNVLALNQVGNLGRTDHELINLLVEFAGPDDVWEFRLRSDPEIALRVLDCDRYWDGEITIPLTIPTDVAAGNDADVNGAVDE